MKTWKLIVLVAALLVIVILGAVGGRWYAGNRKPNFTGKADLYVRVATWSMRPQKKDGLR